MYTKTQKVVKILYQNKIYTSEHHIKYNSAGKVKKIFVEQFGIFIYLFSFLLTINLKLIKVHVEIKIVNKEAATKRSTLLPQ